MSISLILLSHSIPQVILDLTEDRDSICPIRGPIIVPVQDGQGKRMYAKELLDPLPDFPYSPSTHVLEHRLQETLPEFDRWEVHCNQVKYLVFLNVNGSLECMTLLC